MVSIRQNIVSSFASSFSDEDHLYFFRVTLRCDLIAVPYLCVRYPKPPNSINFTISFTYFIVTHRNAR